MNREDAATQAVKDEAWIPGGVPLENESALAFACFCVYRDMGTDRSLRAASEQKVNGKTRSPAQLGKWSSQFDWIARVQAWDTYVAQLAAVKMAEDEARELEDFIKSDMEFAKLVRETCKSGIERMRKEQTIDSKELRNFTTAYGEARGWLSEILEVFVDGDEEG